MKVKIPCRISFAHIWEPKAINGSTPKFSVSCVIPKSDTETIEKIKAAIAEAKEEGKAKWGGKIPPSVRAPFYDGDERRPDDPIYKDSMYVNANSKDAPQIVDSGKRILTDPLDCSSGDYCYVMVNFYPYNAQMNKGVAAGLGNIQKIKTGERLSGRTTADEDFDNLEEDELPEYLR